MIPVDCVGALMWLVLTAYAVTGGADFGGGVWDLLAGGTQRGAAPRDVIDRSIAPVWEANHVWLIIVLVLLWTGFPAAFGDIMTTLFIPLSCAVFGIVLRGSGFAVRHSVRSVRLQQTSGAVFALSSLITPFFFGAVAGAIVTGRVPARGSGAAVASWTSPTALVTGFLAIAAFAYLAAVYLAADAGRLRPELVDYFTRRALAAGLVVGALAALALYELEGSAPRTAHRLTTGAGLPFLVAALLLGAGVLLALLAHRAARLRYPAAAAFVALLWGWAVSQYPGMLPGTLSLAAAAAPTSTLIAELVVAGVIALLVGPSFVLLYHLTQHGRLGEESGAGLLDRLQSDAGEASAAVQRPRP